MWILFNEILYRYFGGDRSLHASLIDMEKKENRIKYKNLAHEET